MAGPDLSYHDIGGARIAVRRARELQGPALLLLHGFPSSSRTFRNVLQPLSREASVIAPDLPGFGESEMLEQGSFEGFADALEELLDQLGVHSFYLYLHDYGAAVGLHLATREPHRIRGLIVQNANAHRTGIGPQWADTIRYWERPTDEAERRATSHLTLEGARFQYIGEVPPDVAVQIEPDCWAEDWRVMSLPGRLDMHRALVLDYRNHVGRFDEIASYLAEHQPPALMIWGRHDPFFDIEETVSWMKALPRMEAHVLDGPHFLLETQPERCSELINGFVRKTEDSRRGSAATSS